MLPTYWSALTYIMLPTYWSALMTYDLYHATHLLVSLDDLGPLSYTHLLVSFDDL